MADSSTSTPASPDLLSALPAELQCKIYSYAVAEGEVNVFETCRAISTHAASVLSRYGVCRIEFNGYKIFSCYPSPGSNAIQNLEIRVNLTATHNGYQSSNTSSIDLLNMWMTNITNSNRYRFRGIFGDTLQGCAPAPKKYCKILFDCSPVFLRQTPTFEAYAQLKLLTSFETLEVEIASNSIPDSIHRMRVRSYAKGPDPRRQLPADSRATLDSIHAAQIARMALEPSLGEAEWVVGKRLYLQFHPRQHVLDQPTAAN